MKRRRALELGAAIAAIGAAGWLLRACYGVFVNEEDQPAADRIVAALHAYNAAKGRYPERLEELVPEWLAAIPVPRDFGRIGYAPLEAGRGCIVGYFTHRDFLKEYDCGANRWDSVEYDESRLVKARPAQWLEGPRR